MLLTDYRIRLQSAVQEVLVNRYQAHRIHGHFSWLKDRQKSQNSKAKSGLCQLRAFHQAKEISCQCNDKQENELCQPPLQSIFSVSPWRRDLVYCSKWICRSMSWSISAQKKCHCGQAGLKLSNRCHFTVNWISDCFTLSFLYDIPERIYYSFLIERQAWYSLSANTFLTWRNGSSYPLMLKLQMKQLLRWKRALLHSLEYRRSIPVLPAA